MTFYLKKFLEVSMLGRINFTRNSSVWTKLRVLSRNIMTSNIVGLGGSQFLVLIYCQKLPRVHFIWSSWHGYSWVSQSLLIFLWKQLNKLLLKLELLQNMLTITIPKFMSKNQFGTQPLQIFLWWPLVHRCLKSSLLFWRQFKLWAIQQENWDLRLL